MDKYILCTVRVIFTLDGAIGFALNALLLFSLFKTAENLPSNAKIYRISIYISSIQGGLLSVAIASMNFVHIFREGTFIITMLGPLVPFLPRHICNVVAQISFVLTTMMFTLIPATSTMQFISLSRVHWSTKKRLSISFAFTIMTIIFLAALTPDFIPTPTFYEFMDRLARDLYKIDTTQTIVAVGSTATKTELNDGRSLLRIIIGFVVIPYTLSYAYFIVLVYLIRKRLRNFGAAVSVRTNRMQKSLFQMQMLQGFLPLAFISIPFVIFIAGAIFQVNLFFAALLFSLTVWFCPVIQATVQLRFVHESNAKHSTEVSKLSKTISNGK